MTTQHDSAELARALGSELRRARETSGLSPAQLAARPAAGVDRDTLLARETGQGELTVVELVRLCGELGTSPAGLLDQALDGRPHAI